LTASVVALGGLAAANVTAWLWAFTAFADRPALLGSALLAWLFGLRHAADADHLAAIDNVVRKLMHEGKQPRLVGLYFSLGHSTIVVLACALIACSASTEAMERFRGLGGLIGTAVSAGFLMVIAMVNLWILVGLVRDRTGRVSPPGGLLVRLLRPAMRLIQRPAHMYPLGFLFGLGFDTATEVGLLALAATQAAAGVSFVQVLIFPALFTAAMALVDTADSVLMANAYGWALMDPGRKFAYNVTVTALSVLLALAIGGVEAGGLVADWFGFQGGAWDMLAGLADGFSDIGYGVVTAFLCAWALAVFFYRRRVPIPISDQVAVQPPSTS
jgi:high-affinity nickel-transport protein